MPKKRTIKPADKAAAIEAVDEALNMVPAVTEPKQLPMPRFVGRTNPASFELQQLAREYTADAFAKVLEIMDDPEAEPATRLEAAKVVLDRGWGKATVKIHAMQTKITMEDVQAKLLAEKPYNDDKWAQAKAVEDGQHCRYLAVDVEVVDDTPAHSEGSIHNSEEGGGRGAAGPFDDSDADSVPSLQVTGEEVYGAFGLSEAAPNLLDDSIQRGGVQTVE